MIAEHMTRAHREVPPVTWVEECDFEDVPLERLLPTVVKACADALVEFPELNARFDGDAILYLDRYDIGVAVQTDDGLVVPVVRGANEKSVDELAAEIAALAERARTGSLGAEDLVAPRSPCRAQASSPGSSRRRSSTTRRSRSSASVVSLRVRSCATARSSYVAPGRSRSPSTTASSTARALRRSASP